MYESFYGLTDKPFQLNPDPSFFFGSQQHRRAMAYLEYGLHQSEGFIVITGEVGAGKTTLVRNLLDKLDPMTVLAAQLVSTQLDATDTLRMVSAAFGLKTKDLQKSDLLLALEAFLLSVTEKGQRALIIVDEAQNLAPGAVEELRMLSNFQIEKHALLQSFLVGQPEFRTMLQTPQMQQLRQRVIASCHVGPMDEADTRAYVEHRLGLVGWQDDPQFEPEVFDEIFLFSGGIPRQINTLCDRLLLSGFLTNKHAFSRQDAHEVAAEVRQEAQGGLLGPIQGPIEGAHQVDPNGIGRQVEPANLSRLRLDPRTAAQATELMATVRASHLEERMMHLERSINVMMILLQELVDSVSRKAD